MSIGNLDSTSDQISVPSLLSVGESWHDLPELPAAYQNSENLITDESLSNWIRTMQKLFEMKLKGFKYTSEELRTETLLDTYRKLKFLSRSMIDNAALLIIDDILANFSASDTLIVVEASGSSRWLYKTKFARFLLDYGTVTYRRGRGLEIGYIGTFQGSTSSDAKNIVYIDDWILTGHQVFEDIFVYLDRIEQLNTYHFVASDRARYLYSRNGVKGKSFYKIIGDDGEDSFFGEFPIYGFHKIPDVITRIYADRAKSRLPVYSIFPQENGIYLGAHDRLIDMRTESSEAL